MEELKKIGKKIVVDFDDNMFSISPMSPHYNEFGVENVKYRMKDGRELMLWEDGKNINLADNRKRMDSIKAACEQADMVTTTTDILADVYKPYSQKVAALPNCIDPALWGKLPLIPHDEIRLFWGGGTSHYEDWCLLSDALPVVMKKHKNVKLVLMGAKFDGTLKQIPKDRVEFHYWVPTPAYPYYARILNADIGLIPLQDTEFNRCKSSLKWVEYSAMSVPSVTSYVSPYKESATENNGVFVENDTEAWIDGLSYLIENKAKRDVMASAALTTINDQFNIHSKYKMWLDAYRELL